MPKTWGSGQINYTLSSGSDLHINFDMVLGQGSFGKVYAGSYVSADGKVDNQKVAIKVFSEMPSTSELEIETQMNLIQGTLYEQVDVEGHTILIMPNLGSPVPNILESNQSFFDATIVEPSQSTWEDWSYNNFATSTRKPVVAAMDDKVDEDYTSSMIIHDDEPPSRVAVHEEGMGSLSMKESALDAEEPTMSFLDLDVPEKKQSKDGLVDDEGSSFEATATFIEVDEKAPDMPVLDATIAHVTDLPFTESFLEAIAAKEQPTLVEGKTEVAAPDFKSPLDFSHFNISEMMAVFDGMAEAVERSHRNGILHMDIKGENFLIDKQAGTVSLIDYGISVFTRDNMQKEARGSLYWMAPELMEESPTGTFGPEQDIYSLGMTYLLIAMNKVYELNPDCVSDKPPIPKDKLNPVIRYMMRGGVYSIEPVYLENEPYRPEIDALNQFVELMVDMTQVEPQNRLSLPQVRKRIEAIQQCATKEMGVQHKDTGDPEVFQSLLNQITDFQSKIESKPRTGVSRMVHLFDKQSKDETITKMCQDLKGELVNIRDHKGHSASDVKLQAEAAIDDSIAAYSKIMSKTQPDGHAFIRLLKACKDDVSLLDSKPKIGKPS